MYNQFSSPWIRTCPACLLWLLPIMPENLGLSSSRLLVIAMRHWPATNAFQFKSTKNSFLMWSPINWHPDSLVHFPLERLSGRQQWDSCIPPHPGSSQFMRVYESHLNTAPSRLGTVGGIWAREEDWGVCLTHTGQRYHQRLLLISRINKVATTTLPVPPLLSSLKRTSAWCPGWLHLWGILTSTYLQLLVWQ